MKIISKEEDHPVCKAGLGVIKNPTGLGPEDVRLDPTEVDLVSPTNQSEKPHKWNWFPVWETLVWERPSQWSRVRHAASLENAMKTNHTHTHTHTKFRGAKRVYIAKLIFSLQTSQTAVYGHRPARDTILKM